MTPVGQRPCEKRTPTRVVKHASALCRYVASRRNFLQFAQIGMMIRLTLTPGVNDKENYITITIIDTARSRAFEPVMQGDPRGLNFAAQGLAGC